MTTTRQTVVIAEVQVLVEHAPNVDPRFVVQDCLCHFEASLGRGDMGEIVSHEIIGTPRIATKQPSFRGKP